MTEWRADLLPKNGVVPIMNTEPLYIRSRVVWIGLILVTLYWSKPDLSHRVCARPFMSRRRGPMAFVSSWYFACLIVAVPVISFGLMRTAKRRNMAAIETARHEKLESIGVIVDSLGDGDTSCEREFRDVLIRLLPLLTDDKAYLLDEYRQAKLRYIVRPPASPIYSTYLTRLSRNSAQSIALRIAIIGALSRVGDSESLTMFDEILDCRACTANERRIQQIVRDSRPHLVERVAAEPTRLSLLRPATDSDSGQLLRVPASERQLPPEEPAACAR